MEHFFMLDKRLGISIPRFDEDFNRYPVTTQQQILLQWEKIRGSIPDQIAKLERQINDKQALLSDESDFQRSCQLNTEIAELASIINDLWLWYRTNQEIDRKAHI